MAILLAICFFAESTRLLASQDDPIERILAAGQQAMWEGHGGRAVQIFRAGLKVHPDDNRLRLDLGRAYLLSRSDGQALRLFRDILSVEPDNRLAKLEMARALGYRQEYAASNRIYGDLLLANDADETAAIGLASNLLHQQRSPEALNVVARVLKFHPNSLRLQEYKDRIESRRLGGEERDRALNRNLAEMGVEFLNDSAGNHSWRSQQRLDISVKPSLTDRIIFEQQFQHSRDDSFEAVETLTQELRWRPRESLVLSAGGGAVRYNNRDVHALYDASLAFQPRQHFVVGGAFSRVPIIPDGEATEHRLTAQGWEAFGSWTPHRWQINLRASQQHYSDENIASRQSGEVIREWGGSRLAFETGYRYRRYSFDHEVAHGYFSPSSYQNHMGFLGVHSHIGKKYRGTVLVRGGVESSEVDRPFRAAWEVSSRNEMLLGTGRCL